MAWLTHGATYGMLDGVARSLAKITCRRSGDCMRMILVLLVVAGAGCSTAREEGEPSTQRQRDSVIGASKLPGAAGVRGALRAADSAAARSARIDSVDR